MANPSNERFHVGAYGILIKDGKILLIKKSRGAYKGMYDLPGGGIEFGERYQSARDQCHLYFSSAGGDFRNC